jgi:hypothetical protein
MGAKNWVGVMRDDAMIGKAKIKKSFNVVIITAMD